jgi:MFS family permease
LFTARAIGKWADRQGKQRVFRWLALAAIIPVLTTTHMRPLPLWLVLVNSTFFFVLVSGRWIPGMAMVSESAALQVRGSFMSLVSSVQMASSGLASLLAGQIISRAEDGRILHYNIDGYIAVASGLATIWLVQHLRVASAKPAPEQAAPEALETLEAAKEALKA